MTFIVKSVRDERRSKTVQSAREAVAAVRMMQASVRGAIKVEIDNEETESDTAHTPRQTPRATPSRPRKSAGGVTGQY